jgi:hypothetical protein
MVLLLFGGVVFAFEAANLCLGMDSAWPGQA